MAQRTGSRAIFDFSTMGAEALHSFLQTADPAGHVSDIKISASALMNPSVGRLLKETGARNLWVECQSQFFPGDPSAFLQRLRTLSEDYRCFPIVGDVPLLAAMVKDGSGIGRIVLKGCEAAGFVSGETTLVLYSAAKEMLHASAKSLDVLIWGGVSTPEAAAAFLSTGAAGIVFESVHWLTDLVVMDDRQRQQLARLRMDSTALVGLDLQVPCRLFNKGNSLAFKKIQAFEDSLCAAEITDESRRAFVGQVQAGALHPLDSHFTQSEVIPLGVEAAFAASFAERFGTGTEKAVKAFMAEMLNSVRRSRGEEGLLPGQPRSPGDGHQVPLYPGRHDLDHRYPGVCLQDRRCRRTSHHRPRPDGCPGPRPQAGTLAGDHGRTPVCGECHLPGREPVPGSASGLDQTNTDLVSSGSPEEISPP